MAVDMFLKLDGIKGESKDDKHKDEIEILSFSWGSDVAVARRRRRRRRGKGELHGLHVHGGAQQGVAAAVPGLCERPAHPVGVLTVRKAGEKPLDYYIIKLTDMLVSLYSQGGSAGTAGEHPAGRVRAPRQQDRRPTTTAWCGPGTSQITRHSLT